MRTGLTLAGFMLLGGCSTMLPQGQDGSNSAGDASAMLQSASGNAAGSAKAVQRGATMRVTLDATGLPPGVHAVHIHTVGKCDAPSFESAGGHWNPDARQHGRDNPAGAHRGDMPNFEAGADGRGSVEFELPAGDGQLLDADGAAIIVHAGADDYRTDPSGNSGGRIACGVFAAS